MRQFIKKIIPKILVEKIKYLYRVNEVKRFKRKCKKNNQKEFYIFNTPIHGNIGDQAIIYAEEKLLESYNIEAYEIATFQEHLYFDIIKKYCTKDACISITGGGFIGSQWMLEENLVIKVVDTFKNHRIIIFPQTLYFKNDEQGKKELQKSIDIFNNAKDLHIFAREKRTYEFAKDTYKSATVELIPDIVLSLSGYDYNFDREGVLLCFRKDVEKVFSDKDMIILNKAISSLNLKCDKTDTVEDIKVLPNERGDVIDRKLKEFSKYKLVITDRLHGMVFAAITNTPCIVFGNYNYKVEGVFDWIKNKNIIFKKNMENIEDNIVNLLDNKNYSYDKKIEYENEYKKLYELLEEI